MNSIFPSNTLTQWGIKFYNPPTGSGSLEAPPLVWGIRGFKLNVEVKQRITPTYVGTTSSSTWSNPTSKNHPLQREEYYNQRWPRQISLTSLQFPFKVSWIHGFRFRNQALVQFLHLLVPLGAHGFNRPLAFRLGKRIIIVVAINGDV